MCVVTVDFLGQSVHLAGREFEEGMESRAIQAIRDPVVMQGHQ